MRDSGSSAAKVGDRLSLRLSFWDGVRAIGSHQVPREWVGMLN
jgi:hypothetical protein